MPYADNGEVRLYYESTGSGEPVLLIMGLGIAATGWWRTVRVLSPHLQVIAFDNRGVGRSARVPGPYTVVEMASDAASVLDAASIQRAHIYGISLGGMIAQELALLRPERVRSLVLGATTPGGAHAVQADPETLAFLNRRAQMPAEEAVWASVPYNYAPATRARHGDRIAQDIVERLRYPIEPASYEAQLAAALSHDASDRLGSVSAPTLVVHGEEDRLISPENAPLIESAIDSAKLELWPGAAHLYTTDEPRADASILEFLTGQSGADPQSQAPQ